MISLKNDKIYTLVNNVVLLKEEGSTYNNNNLGTIYSNQNQNSLLVKRQNDNTSPGDWPRKISP